MCVGFLLGPLLVGLPRFIHSASVHRVRQSLVQVDKKHCIVPETGEEMGGRYGDDEGKDVINEGVEGLVREGLPGHMRL